MTPKRRLVLTVVVVVVAVAFALVTRLGTSSSGSAADSPSGVVTVSTAGRQSGTAATSNNSTASNNSNNSTRGSSGTTSRPAGSAATSTTARGASIQAPPGLETVSASALPPEGRTTLRLIDNDGPFPYNQDGVVFENRERHLTTKPSGYYHEYTVVTPGSPDRGTRRIITGASGERFYTADHYATFRLVVDG